MRSEQVGSGSTSKNLIGELEHRDGEILDFLAGTGSGRWEDLNSPFVSDELRAVIEPLLPSEPPNPKGGRLRCNDRLPLAGIIILVCSGILWKILPRELGCSDLTRRRRLRDLQRIGFWTRLRHGPLGCWTSALELPLPRQQHGRPIRT